MMMSPRKSYEVIRKEYGSTFLGHIMHVNASRRARTFGGIGDEPSFGNRKPSSIRLQSLCHSSNLDLSLFHVSFPL
jgi:hypothetical protein